MVYFDQFLTNIVGTLQNLVLAYFELLLVFFLGGGGGFRGCGSFRTKMH